MACRIERNAQGNITKVFDPNGKESALFNELARVPGTNLETALDQYIKTLDPEVSFVQKEINKGLTSNMFLLGDDVRIGSIRTLPYKEGVKVDSSIVTEAYRGQGIGYELYLETIRNLMIEGKKLYSDGKRTAPAERIWEKLVEEGLAVKNVADNTYETILVDGVTIDTTIDSIIEKVNSNNTAPDSVFYRVGDVTHTSYSSALNSTNGQDIQIGVIKKGKFVALETRSSNTNPKTEIGWINNAIKETIINDKNVVQDGEVFLDVAGFSTESQLVNDNIVKDFAHQNGMKAQMNPDGTFKLVSMEVTESYPEKGMVDGIYNNMFGDNRTSGIFIETDSQLSQQILSFLEKLGFSVASLQDYVRRYAQKNGVVPNAEALVDFANQVVAFRDGNITEDALTEEFVHIMLEALPQDQLENALRNVHTTKEYSDNYETYMQIYKDEAMVRKEVLGKIVANGLQGRTEATNIFQDAWNRIVAFINSFVKTGFQREVDNLTDRVHDMLIRQDPSQLEDLSKRKFRMYRADNTLPNLVNRAVQQIQEDEARLSNASGVRYIIEDALQNINDKREKLSVINLADLARRQTNYVKESLRLAEQDGTMLSGEERVVALNLKNVIQPLISRVREEVENIIKGGGLSDVDREDYAQVLEVLRNASDEISMINTSPSEAVKQNLIDKVFEEDPSLRDQTIKGIPSREYFETAFEQAESDTNFLYSMVGTVSSASDVLLGMMSNVVKRMTNRAHYGFFNTTQKVQNKMRELGIKPKDWSNFYDKNGWIKSYWDYSTHEQKKQAAEKEALEYALGEKIDDLDPNKDYLGSATQEQREAYVEKLRELRPTYETQKFTEEFYKERQERRKNLSLVTRRRLNQLDEQRAAIMRLVKKDSKGRPIFTKRDKLALEAYNIERRKFKNVYDLQGNIRQGLELNSYATPNAVQVTDGWLSLKDTPSEDAIIAFEMIKYDQESLPRDAQGNVTRSLGLSEEFLTQLDGMTADQARNFVEANVNIGLTYEEQDTPNIPEGSESDWEALQEIRRKRRELLSNFRDPKNASNILPMDTSTQRRVRQLTDDAAVYQKRLRKAGLEVEVSEDLNFGVNNTYRGWIRDEGMEGNAQKQYEKSLEHVPESKRAYLNDVLTTLDLVVQKYSVSPLNEQRLEREFPGVDFQSLSREEISNLKLQAVQRRLPAYFVSVLPQNVATQMDNLRNAKTAEGVKNILRGLDSNPAVEMSMHFSFYEGIQDDSVLNPEYNQNYIGSRYQPKDINPEFNSMLGLTSGTYTLDEYGIPVMNTGFKATPQLESYRLMMEAMVENLTLQNELGHTPLYQAPQMSRTTTNKLFAVIENPSRLREVVTESLNEISNFRIDELGQGELDEQGNSLYKQGIRVVPKRYVRKLEVASDVSNDLFYTVMMMNRESHLHKSRKESLSEVIALEDSLINRKYNTTSKKGESTNTYKMFKSFMEYNFFGVNEVMNYRVEVPFIGTVDLAKLSRFIHKYTGHRNLVGSTIIALTSWVTAETALIIEGKVRQFVDTGSLNKARKEMLKLTPEAFTEDMNIMKKGKLQVLAQRLNIFDFQDSYENSINSKATRFISKLGYSVHTAGNFSPVMTAMLSNLMGHRFYKGQFLNYNDYLTQRRREEPNIGSKQVRAEWNAMENKSFYNYVEVTDGNYQKRYDVFASDNGLNLDEATSLLDTSEGVLTIKTQKMVETIDGMIRPEDRVYMQRHFLLNFLMLHKGWLSIAIARRFKSGHYNTATKTYEEGTYITGANALKKLVLQVTNIRDPKQAWKNIIDMYAEGTPEERMNLRRIMIEMGILSTIYALSLGLSGYADDDENKDNWTVQYAAYITERLVNETQSTQLGIGGEILNTLQTPIISLKDMRKAWGIGQLFNGDEIKSGRYRGLSGTSYALINTIPGLRPSYTIWSGENINYQRNTYRFYQSPDELQPLSLLINSKDVKEMFNK